MYMIQYFMNEWFLYSKRFNLHSSIYNEKNRNEAFNVSADEATHMLDGNLGGKVKAISLMVQAKQHMESLIKSTPKTSFYNVGSGAKIEKAEPLYADDVLPIARKQDNG